MVAYVPTVLFTVAMRAAHLLPRLKIWHSSATVHQRTRVGEIQDGFSLYSFQSIGTGCSFNDTTVPGGYNCYIPSVCFWWPGFKEGWAGVGQQEPCLDGFVYCVAVWLQQRRTKNCTHSGLSGL